MTKMCTGANGAVEHTEHVWFFTQLSGVDTDTETYYLSAESPNRWTEDLPYNKFSMRTCVGVNFVTMWRIARDHRT